ncbi:type II/IV secretion system protein [Gleimia coleocanis DSM 15436]|uniref:Type II/IV secretion system protein n=1 Tax=Gleimia coleocanis DSM 15436 TaxID=525245 RepID=C0VZP6_9ACTO|nr:ATPase, T2SS/T4P/T4SS family [Gleimia coleocanis]EEH63755.1 type II/IV secretion system protein [Gleimia coleocanis DSM 15436]
MVAIEVSERRQWVRAKVAEIGFDPVLESSLLKQVVADSFTRFPAADSDQERAHTTQLLAEIGGYGELQQFLNDPSVEEIYINSPAKIFVAKAGKSELTNLIMTAEEVKDLVERMLYHSGRRLDLSVPFVDAMLPGGERLHVVIPPVAGREWSLNIRKHLKQKHRLADLVALNMLPEGAATQLIEAMATGKTVVVSGATQAGKTTFLRALAQEIPAKERILTCEEVFELNLNNYDCVALQTRNANIEGIGAVTLRDLVRECMRMRPERIIVGEVRGAESLDMLLALNAGVPGMSTIHANSAADALRKLTMLPLLAADNVSLQFVIPTVANCIDLVVHLEREMNGFRHVAEISQVTGRSENGHIEAVPLWKWNGADLVPTGLTYEQAGH